MIEANDRTGAQTGSGRERRMVISITLEEPGGQDGSDSTCTVTVERTVRHEGSCAGTIYQKLEEALGVKIQPASDEWDRKYNVDFYIEVGKKFIGLQIKPAGHAYITEVINELKFQETTQRKFTEKFGGKVFYVISVADGKNKVIQNPEVIGEIRKEIERLRYEETQQKG